MSDVHAQTSAIFEKLHDERGQPDELDDAFIQEYFKLVKDHVKLDIEEAEVGPLVVQSTEVRLFGPDSGLIELYVRDEKEMFIASRRPPVKVIQGTSAMIGQHRGHNEYQETNLRGFIKITINTSTSLLLFVFPTKFHPFPNIGAGEGDWVPVES